MAPPPVPGAITTFGRGGEKFGTILFATRCAGAISSGTIGLTGGVVQTAFDTAYAQSFSRLLPGIPVRIVNLRTTAIGRRPKFDLRALAPDKDANVAAALRGARPVWFDGRWHETAVWERLDLPADTTINGPAVFEQPDATTIVEPGLAARIDDFGNLIIERR